MDVDLINLISGALSVVLLILFSSNALKNKKTASIISGFCFVVAFVVFICSGFSYR